MILLSILVVALTLFAFAPVSGQGNTTVTETSSVTNGSSATPGDPTTTATTLAASTSSQRITTTVTDTSVDGTEAAEAQSEDSAAVAWPPMDAKCHRKGLVGSCQECLAVKGCVWCDWEAPDMVNGLFRSFCFDPFDPTYGGRQICSAFKQSLYMNESTVNATRVREYFPNAAAFTDRSPTDDDSAAPTFLQQCGPPGPVTIFTPQVLVGVSLISVVVLLLCITGPLDVKLRAEARAARKAAFAKKQADLKESQRVKKG